MASKSPFGSGIYPLVNIQKTDGKITMLLMGKSTMSMTMFNSFLYVYQMVSSITPIKITIKSHSNPMENHHFQWVISLNPSHGHPESPENC